MSKRGKKKNRELDQLRAAGSAALFAALPDLGPAMRFASHLSDKRETVSLTMGKQWHRCHCADDCGEPYPLDWVWELVPVMQVVIADGQLAWLETLTQVFYDARADLTVMAAGDAKFDGSPLAGLNVSSCPSIHTAARLWRRGEMDLFANLVVDGCSAAVALLTHDNLPEPLASIRREVETH